MAAFLKSLTVSKPSKPGTVGTPARFIIIFDSALSPMARIESAEGEVIEGLTLRIYNRETAEWSLYWANARNGTLSLPPTVGRFAEDGHGEFYDREELNGRSILVRFVWSDITSTTAHFEQSFSEDDGASWEVNWISDQTRIAAKGTEM